jgi:glycosyltransferase involved in cell wall biosynthesis
VLSLSIIIPAYNEETRLPATLDAVLRFLRGREWRFVEILVVDDGSTDKTREVVERYEQRASAVRLLRNPGNRGKGYSVRHGMMEGRGDWLLFSDADLSTPIEELDALYAAAEKAGADIAFGSRAVNRKLVSVRQSAFREFSGRFFNLVMRAITGLPHHDTQCGFKLYRAAPAKEVFRRQRLDGFGFDVEDLFIARRLGLKAVETPVRWANVEGTKVRLGHGLKAFWDLAVVRWNGLRGLYR